MREQRLLLPLCVWSVLMRQKAALLWVAVLLFSLSFSACTQGKPSVSRTIFAMDTVMTLTVQGERAKEALDAAISRIFELEALLSVTNEQSEIFKLNHAEGADVQLSHEVYTLLETAVAYSEQFHKIFDCTISPVVALWGFYTDEFRVPSPEELEDALSSVNFQNVQLKDGNIAALKNGAQVDLGGIAKGYAAEKVRDILCSYQIKNAILDLGGNVLALGKRNGTNLWRVAVRDPTDTTAQLCVFQVSDLALVTSGSYQRYFEKDGVRYHHILDPKTGLPTQNDLLSVTIITENAIYADVLSTALFIMGYEDAVSFWKHKNDFEVVFVLQSGEVVMTEGAAAYLDGQIDATTLFR